MQQRMSDEKHRFTLKRVTVGFSLGFTGNGINEDISVAEDLISVFVSLKVTAVRDLDELSLS